MVDSLYSAITNVEQAQSQKEVTINEGFDRISAMVAATFTQVITSGDFTPTSANPTPEWQTATRFVLTGTPGTPRLMIVPVGSSFSKLFIVQNDSDDQVTVQVGAGPSGTTVVILASAKAFLYSDGTDITAEGGAGASDFISLSDTPGSFAGEALRALRVNTGETALEFVNFPGTAAVEKFIFVPVEGHITPTATGGSAVLATVATAGDQPDVTSLNFDQTTAEHAQLRHIFEEAAHLGNVSIQFLWSHAGATTFGLVMNVKGVAVADDETLGVSFSVARPTLDTGGTTDDHYLSPRTGFIKFSAPAELDYIILDLFRDPVDAGDDLDVDARLQGIIIHYIDNYPLDEHWASVELLAGFDGLDTATDQDDESDSLRVATYVGNAQVDTAQSRFSRGSLLVDGTTDAATFPDSADWDFGTGDFTVEGHFRWAADTNAFQTLLGQWDSSASQKAWVILYTTGTNLMEFYMSANGSTNALKHSFSFTPSVGTWYHIVVSFDGTTYRFYIDGVLRDTSTSLTTPHNSTVALSIGGEIDGAFGWEGNADEIRVTKGVDRYPAAFTALTLPFPRG